MTDRKEDESHWIQKKKGNFSRKEGKQQEKKEK